MEEGLSRLIETLKKHHPDADTALVEKAHAFAKKHHGTQLRASGDPYYHHPIAVAQILADFKLDTSTIITAILHDTVEDTDVTFEDIEREFGKEISKLVDGVTKLTKLELQSEDTKQAENFRKLLIAISEDLRVLLVKLADRIHNMRTLHFIAKPEKRARIAHETMEIFAPLAERIGVQKMKDELQDLAFRELHGEEYKSIINRLEYLRSSGGKVVDKIVADLKETLIKAGIKAYVSGREKTPYSIWRKMGMKNVSFEQLTDIIAFRTIVDNIEDCYKTLGIIHATYHNVPGSFKDFISLPKENGYRSIHTVVMGPDHQRIEIQIRSKEMHDIAEFGVAAHWAYKQGQQFNTDGKQYRWVRELMTIIEQAPSAEEFFEHTKMEMYHDQVFCFTPKGRLIALPRGATPVDFAFAVHSEVGRTCVGAKVNGRIIPLRTQLNNGDQVEIIRSKSQKPSPTWEKFVVTGKARSEIRRYVRVEQKSEYIQLGKNILVKLFKEEGLEMHEKDLVQVLPLLEKQDIEELYAAVGEGLMSKAEVLKAVYPDREVATKRKKLSILNRLKRHKEEESGEKKLSIPIRGIAPGMAVHFAGCCHPLPGESIVGIVNTGKAITIHTADCHELERYVDEPERWIDVAWEDDSNSAVFVGRLKLSLAHETGSLGTLANTVAKAGGNINNLRIVYRSTEFYEMLVDVEVKDVKHLANVMASLRAKSAIYSVERYVKT
ncbi:MAG: bifunctional (p)ppGpp synthetase/guanosine-3',5'-bis(diphosphate) 3'-pyrophosphohydrolase [Proteobacteria bacterium]|nr:bifunctional (p)ppGpp synthetase/guanosine-3',5'-bis(diphosphate) 3'-pyrophosphohydrolase [Pseudomonadota bacterium]